MSPPVSIRWAELLADAVSRPGQILEAYSLFHGYSLGNQLAAMFQCRERRLAPGRSPPSSGGTSSSGAFGPARRPSSCACR
ncbi:MAG: hypothetical protein IPP07_30160 [Holophagales bacterium]|nr:hypothetical protein [Holophagales bacterium]